MSSFGTEQQPPRPPSPPTPPPPAPPPPGQPAKSNGLVIGGFALALAGFFLLWVPFAGYLGLVGLILVIVGYSRTHQGVGFVIASSVLGLLALAGGVIWTLIAATASCPHVYSYDGSGYRLDGDMLSGSLYEGAESDDLAHLEHAALVGGELRLRVADERQERDVVDKLELLAVDHDASLTPVATPGGELRLLASLAAPLAARDGRGRDLRDLLSSRDGRSWQGEAADHDPSTPDEPRDQVELTLPGVAPGSDAYLVLRARNSEVATEALYAYLAQMGPGLKALLALAETDRSYPYRQRLADELERMGVPLRIEVRTADGWQLMAKLPPVGPAATRYQAVRLPAAGGAPIEVRLSAPPLFWEIDHAAVGVGTAVPTAAITAYAPRLALLRDGEDVTRLLRDADAQRVQLAQGERVDVTFAVPDTAPAGSSRSFFLRMRGYYEVDIGGRGVLNPIALYRHHSGSDSLSRFLLRRVRS